LNAELEKRGESLRLYASRQDHLGVTSVAPVAFDAKLDSNMSGLFGGLAFWQSKMGIRLRRGDVLILNGNPRILSNYPLWFFAKLRGVPVIWWGHGWSAGSHGRRSGFRRLIMRFADAVLLYTDREREDYLALGFAQGQIFALNNGLDVGHIDGVCAQYSPARIEAFRSANGLEAFRYWCVFLGRLSEKSGINLLIESLPAIRNDVGLIILGDGPCATDARARAMTLGVAQRVVWAGAQFDEKAVAPWMLCASAFVYPGAVGLSLIHGLAYGLPAVVHDDAKNQMPEFAAFEDGVNGLSFERGSAASLSLTIDRLFESDVRREAMAKSAGAQVHRTFNVPDMTRRFMEVIDSVRAH
jgi:glycosyltransferase involved in cell wall biosynthesis